MLTVAYVVLGTKTDASAFARVLDIPRKHVVSDGQLANEVLRGQLAHAVLVPALDARLIDADTARLFRALRRVDEHNLIASATRRMDEVHASRATRRTS